MKESESKFDLAVKRLRSNQGHILNNLGSNVYPMLHTEFRGHQSFCSRDVFVNVFTKKGTEAMLAM